MISQNRKTGRDEDGGSRYRVAGGCIVVLVAALAIVAVAPAAASSSGSPVTTSETPTLDGEENSSATPPVESAATLELADAQGEVGSSVLVELRTDDPDVTGYSVDVRYDPDAVSVEDVNPAELDGQLVVNRYEGEGQVRVAAAAAQPAGNGSPVLAELLVEPETESEHVIALGPDSYVTNDSGVQIDPEISNATLSVSADDDGGLSPPESTDDNENATGEGSITDDGDEETQGDDLGTDDGRTPSPDPDPAVETNGTADTESDDQPTGDEMPVFGPGTALGLVFVGLTGVLYRRRARARG